VNPRYSMLATVTKLVGDVKVAVPPKSLPSKASREYVAKVVAVQ
jgi:hypothetical protein